MSQKTIRSDVKCMWFVADGLQHWRAEVWSVKGLHDKTPQHSEQSKHEQHSGLEEPFGQLLY